MFQEIIHNWKYTINIKRREYIIITLVRIRHSRLTHSYLISKVPIPTYDLCKEIYSDPLYPKYTATRKNLQQFIFTTTGTHSIKQFESNKHVF